VKTEMTDSLEALAQPETPSILGAGLMLDASAVDKNLRAIRQVESTWRLPSLPDEVRLDLATQSGLQPQHVSSFLYGIEKDAFGEDAEDFDPLEPEIPPLTVVNRFTPFTENEATAYQETLATISTLRGLPTTDVVDPNAVQRFKMEAIQKGYLEAPEGGVVDGSWSPALSTVQREMQYQAQNDYYRGNRTAASSFENALNVLNDWTSPSGLMRMAVNLDLFWDFNALQNEFESWGDKWRKVGDSKNPLDFGRNLLDAMTGPIDDFVVPIINVALLFAGVGSTWNFARLGATGARGAAAASAFNEARLLYRVPGVSRIFPALGTAEKAGAAYKGLAEASWMANRFQKGGETAQLVGRGMEAWRAWEPVVQSKRIIQVGMRAGLVSQAEDRFLPGYQGGLSLGENTPVGDAADRVLQSGPGFWATQVGEVLLTPYNFFEPGTFTRGGKDLLGGTFKMLGTASGRAAVGGVVGAGIGAAEGDTEDVLQGAAIGAGAGAALPAAGRTLRKLGITAEGIGVPKVVSSLVRLPGEALARTSWANIAHDQKATSVFYEAFKRRADSFPDGTFKSFDAFDQVVRSDGFYKALGQHYGIESDERSVGGLMAFVLVSAALDYTASAQAAVGGADGFRSRFWLAKNKLTAQLRSFDPATVREEELAWAAVSKDMANRRGLASKQRQLLKDYERLVDKSDPHALAELVSQHNQQAALTMRQLLSPDNLPIQGLTPQSMANLGAATDVDARWSSMADYIGTTLDSFGNWSKYAPATEDLGRFIRSGMFDEARLVAPVGMRGHKLSQVEYLAEYSPPTINGEEFANDLGVRVEDTLFLNGQTAERWRQKGGHYAVFAREVDPGRSRFTLMRKENPAAAEIIEAADEIKQALNTFDAWDRAIKLQQKRVDESSRVLTAAGKLVTDEALAASKVDFTPLGTLGQTQMTEYTKALGLASESNDAKALRQLNFFAQKHGLSVDEAFKSTIDNFIQTLGEDVRWSERYGLDLFPSEITRNAEGITQQGRRLTGRQLLEDRRKALHEKARFTAKEIDTEDLVNSVRKAKGDKEADALKQYLDHAESQGYKVVYGAEFLSPEDLLHRTGLFSDINERHLNAMTLGNFFGRKQPEALRLAVERSQRSALAARLGEAAAEKVDPDSPIVDQAMKDLYQLVLDPEQAAGAIMMDDIAHQTWLSRRISGVKSYDVPLSLQDLGLGRNRSKVIEKLTRAGWEENQAQAIWLGLKEGRHSEWSDLGLAAVEAKLRGKNQLVDALQFLGGTKNSPVLKRALVGGALGAGAAAVTDQDILTGAAVGAGAGAVTSGKALGQVTERLTNALDYSTWARYGYLADNLANLRDRFRFTLSPFFDLSRYTESHFLAQVGAPKRLEGLPAVPEGHVRLFRGEALDAAVAAGAEAARASKGLSWIDQQPEMITRKEVRGRWFTDDRALAETYPSNRDPGELNRLVYVDVPKAEYDKMIGLQDQPAEVRKLSLSPEREIVLPKAYTSKVRSVTRDEGKRLALPLNQSPRGLRRAWANEFKAQGFAAQDATNAANDKFKALMADFRRAAKTEFDPDALESTGKWFQQIGIMGYNPTAHMASTFHHLRQAGMKDHDAWKAVKSMYTYGTTGRSAAEMSVNFVFFPFSFQKKTITHAAEWLADDLVRSVLIHDAFKSYEWLNERYDLTEWQKDHLPVLEKLQQLNLFAYGISPGRLGGINAPFVNAVVGNPLSDDPGQRGLVLNLFTPQGVNIANAEQAAVVQRLVQRSIPAIYDLQHFLEDAKSQGDVIFDPTHQTRSAQARDGYQEWGEFKSGVQAALEQKGFTWGQLATKPELEQLNAFYIRKRLELEKKYPGWKESKDESLQRIFERNQALKTRLDTAEFYPQEASPTDIQLLQFNMLYEQVKTKFREQGVDDVEDWSPAVLDELRGVAVEMSQRNRNFLTVYQQFYERELGPISTTVGR
jgi:hypothetical protein